MAGSYKAAVLKSGVAPAASPDLAGSASHSPVGTWCLGAAGRHGKQWVPLPDFSSLPLHELVGLDEAKLRRLLAQAIDAVACSRPGQQSHQPAGTGPGLGASPAFVDMMLADGREARQASRDLVRTENGALTYATSGSAAVDFMYGVMDSTSPEGTREHLEKAWDEDPLTAIRLVAHLRDVRMGKGVIRAGQECLTWLRERHPLTLAANLEEAVKVGYWKDLLEVLARHAIGPQVFQARQAAKEEHDCNKRHWRLGSQRKWDMRDARRRKRAAWLSKLQRMARLRGGKATVQAAKQRRAAEVAQREAKQHAEATRRRREGRARRHKVARAMLQQSPVHRMLHLAVAAAFARALQADLAALRAGRRRLSLAGKWAPSGGGAHDRDTLIGTTIAFMMFPGQQQGQQRDAQFVHNVRIRYQREVLRPLRRALQLPEVYMSAKQWDQVVYTRVASVCMKNNKDKFEAHDGTRFAQYLETVKEGTTKIAAGALKPHELVAEAQMMALDMGLGVTTVSGDVLQLQWEAYVRDVQQGGMLRSALAVCDVSGSMMGQPMQVAIALSLLTAEVAQPPFDRIVCTFSSRPEFHRIQGRSLAAKVNELAGLDWEMNTDFEAVFKMILQRAKQARLPRDAMVQTCLVFSDMEFDEAEHGVTNFESIKAQFKRAGYDMPRLVFWNLRDDLRYHGRGRPSVPVQAREDGTALVSGFSGQLLKLFMAGDVLDASHSTAFNPESIMRKAIDKRQYAQWLVVD